jgi:hypothetical protein
LTRGQLDLGAIFMYDEDRDGAVDLHLGANHSNLDITERRRYGASCLTQPSEPRCYAYTAVSRFGRRDAEDVPNQIPCRSALLQPWTGVPQPQHSPKVS